MTQDNISKDYDHKNEKKWQTVWQEKNLYKFIGDGSRPRYVIDTPPPYPTGSIHMGHVLNWVYMDLVARYKRMNGYDVLFPQGWDCHGLPTEVKVEETNNIKKNDVSREKFRELCVELTSKNIEMMRTQMNSLGFTQDWSREYITMTPEYMRKTQLSFLKMYEDGLIYQGIHPVNWCPRCETAIAFAEVEYSDNETYLLYLNFPAADGGKGVEIATTRPELISACVGVVVHPDDERYQHLKGKTVKVPLFGQEVTIITDEEVDPEFGTGAVMVCTFGDKTDVAWVKQHNLDIIEAIDEKGIMTTAAGKYQGLTLKECKKQTAEDLEKEGYLFKKEKVEQNVGQCWRCKTPIEILVKKQWFIAANKLSNDIKQATHEMTWLPEHMKSRLINWADSMDWDWCISRQRIFATPIPVWYCKDCGKVHLPTEDMIPIDPTQTQPKWKCDCGCDEFIPEEDVLDTWMDSSISPLNIAGWPDPGFMDLFPANLRPQGHDIIRTWAFYTTLRTKALTGLRPFDEIVINGMVFGEDGNKMSKSLGNTVAPETVLEDYGADSLRIWASNSMPGSDVPFAWNDVKYGYKFLRKFWNAFRFISMHIFDFNAKEEDVISNLTLTDQWILSKLNNLIADVSEAFENFEFAKTINPIQSFIWHDFCDEYIEAVKYRLYGDDISEESKIAAKYTLKTIIITSLKLLAPITPHFTEEIYQYFQDESIHSSNWPAIQEDLIDLDIEEQGEILINTIADLRRFKSASKMPLNAPIKTVNIYTTDEKIRDVLIEGLIDIAGTLKIGETDLILGKINIQEKVVEITPNMGKIGPEFRKDAPKIVSYLTGNDPDEIARELEENGKITIEGYELTEEYMAMKKEVVSQTGQKVDVIHSENQDIVFEIIK